MTLSADAPNKTERTDGTDNSQRVVSNAEFLTAHITLSHFTDVKGSALVERNGTWADFCAWIERLEPQPVKAESPLIKFARFGSVRTDKGSLRHDANVIEVTGIEGDYDDEAVTPDEAIARLERAGVRALVVTTHTHTPENPRWRVFAPLSASVHPAERKRLVGRLNGALYGCLARESFTLSQSYFVGGRPGGEYRTLHTFDDPEDGECIDRIDALDALARFSDADTGKPGEKPPRRPDG